MKCHCTNNPTVRSHLNKNPDCSFNHAQSRVSRQSKAVQRRQNSGDRQRAEGSGIGVEPPAVVYSLAYKCTKHT